MMKRVLACLLLTLPLAGWAEQLTVAAAASLTDSFKAIGVAFEARYPGTQVRFNFAASGALLQQIANGAPVDVFASADEETMDRAAAYLQPGSRRDFTGNALVLITPRQAPLRLDDLGTAKVRRIAIGKPASVPAGRYAQQRLLALRLWEPLQPKLVFADNVRQVLDYVARGEVEAGFVYRSDALLLSDRVQLVATLSGHADVRYPIAILKDSRQAQRAADFLAYLASTEAQVILRRSGFSPLP